MSSPPAPDAPATRAGLAALAAGEVLDRTALEAVFDER